MARKLREKQEGLKSSCHHAALAGSRITLASLAQFVAFVADVRCEVLEKPIWAGLHARRVIFQPERFVGSRVGALLAVGRILIAGQTKWAAGVASVASRVLEVLARTCPQARKVLLEVEGFEDPSCCAFLTSERTPIAHRAVFRTRVACVVS